MYKHLNNKGMTTISNGKYRLEIFHDENCESPRENECNSCIMVCFHKRYNLGDKHDLKIGDYSSWAEVETEIKKRYNVAVISPLYLYDHSGITISTVPFSSHWDSGQVGYIFMTKDVAKSDFGKKLCTKKVKELAMSRLISEVKTYDQYLTGDVYGFKVFKDNVEIDSCYGFYGENIWLNDMDSYIDDEVINELLPELEKEFHNPELHTSVV